MQQAIDITESDIEYAEKILLAEGQNFDDERRAFIKNFEVIDLQAVPGSGKTTALLAKLLILERKLPFANNSGILVLSHTNVAIDEIRHKIELFCPKLFRYPNFIGTIQSFVDEFLAIPYYTTICEKKPVRIDNEIYEERVNHILQNRWLPKYNLSLDDLKKIQNIKMANQDLFKNIRLDTNDVGEIILIKELNDKEKLKVKKPKGADYSNEEKEKLYEWFLSFKKNILKQGILHFDDAYFLAKAYLFHFPKIKEIIQKRFSYVFVDEMQDMETHQYDLLEKLFYDDGNSTSIFQRIGDKNQAIFNNIESNEVNWIDRRNNLVLTNSHRLSSKIANVVKSFALNNPNNFDIIGLNECDIKPHIILFDDTSKEKVISKFAELVKEFKEEGRLIDYGKYPIKAICWNAKWKSVTELRITNYFPTYKKDNTKSKQDYDTLKDYLLFYDRNSKTLKSIKNNIINAFLKVLRFENILDDNERYFTKYILFKTLKEKCLEEYQKFNLKLYHWSMFILKGKLDEAYNEIKSYMNDFIKIFDKTKNLTIGSNFFNQESQVLQVSDNIEELKDNNLYTEGDINIEIATVHSVKGQTHCATLYLESFYYNDGGKSYESQRLADAFLGNSITNRGIRIKQSLKMTYVGFSRPTNLLCVAIHKDRFTQCLSQINTEIWEIKEIN
ncbi:UvrD-helicase domain-containing protein [Capnocytophaga granulosa]|uniref:UvrD-helicase domain-containing protein n=1 Tax=Capnocytophaga granulosa TaxID=45242 RepID=UPI0028ECACD1|nr:UvrD-helicase domain-containing protein [Capnocytophaga granulosa]